MFTAPLNVIGELDEPLQIAWLAGWATSGVGFTVMVKSRGVPGQPLLITWIFIVAVKGALVLLMAVNEGILPKPEDARPMDGVLFVQL